MWSKTTKPTPANIRRRISSAQEAIDAAMDLVKRRATERGDSGRRLIVPLDNAYAWLQQAQRRISEK